jgi:hypothetical protein
VTASPAQQHDAPWTIQVDPNIYRELAWFFLVSASELGLKSGHAAVVARIEGQSGRTTAGGPKEDDGGEAPVRDAYRTVQTPWDRDEDNRDIFDRLNDKIDSISKHRRIRAGLEDMPRKHVSTLCAMFEERTWPNALAQTFGEAAGLAVSCAVARDAYKEASGRKRVRSAGVREWLDNYCRHQAKTEEGSVLIATIRTSMRQAVLEAFAEYGQCRRVPKRGGR